MKSARKIAEWFINRNRKDAGECPDNFLTHMQLQKFLYYAQGYFLGCYGVLLFQEEIQAWPYGPVVPNVYNLYKKNKGKAIDEVYECRDEDFTAEELRAMNIVYDKYSCYSGTQLSNMTHKEMPWKSTEMYQKIEVSKLADYFEDAMMSKEEEEELDSLKQKAVELPVLVYDRSEYEKCM